MNSNRRGLGMRVLAGVALVTGMVAWGVLVADQTEDPAKPNRAREFTQLDPSDTPTDFLVMTDPHKVLGWVTGDVKAEGQQVTIKHDGKTHKVKIGEDNLFVWNHGGRAAGPATITWNDQVRHVDLPVAEHGQPVVFFVVDRTAYRPNQTLHFAAFLRQEHPDGEFHPRAKDEVVVKLTSASKNTVAAEMILKSDEFGRIVGEYRFSDADALDNYRLTVNNYKGTADVKLAEFRKAKVRLTIDGTRRDRQLKLKFRALDFLDKPVAGSKVRFTAKVYQSDQAGEDGPLDGTKFAVGRPVLDPLARVRQATEDQQLLVESGLQMVASPARTHLAAELQGNVEVGDDGEGETTLTLQPAWTRGSYNVQVEGVLTDYNGREQRATKTIAVGSKVTDCDLALTLDKRNYRVGEKIRLQLQATGDEGEILDVPATVMAMKLSPVQPATPRFGYGYYGGFGYNQFAFNVPFNGSQAIGNNSWNVAQQAAAGQPRRTLVTAQIVRDSRADFRLDEPGAYKLVCIAEMKDGRKLKNEVGCIVRARQDFPGLILNVDREDLKAGERLTGQIHCRFKDAKVLLTLRDSLGYRLWRVYTVRDGLVTFNERLPRNVRYGGMVEVQYLESERRLHEAHRYVRVDPLDRSLDVKIETAEQYRPGKEVELNIEVNRRERVDLVVSVYDQSLLGISADKSVGPRDFFLADERVGAAAAQERLRRVLGAVTADELFKAVEKRLAEDTTWASSQPGHQARQALNQYRNQRIYFAGLLVLLRQAGVNVTPGHNPFAYYGWVYHVPKGKNKLPASLSDILAHRRNHPNSWRVYHRFVGDRLVLMEYHPQYISSMTGSGGMLFGGGGYGMGAIGGNSAFSATANGFFSQLPVSGQAVASHIAMPFGGVAPQLELLDDSSFAGEVRRDFSDSAYWNARVRTDSRGRATFKLKLPDSLTNWQVVVTAISPKMHVGRGRASFRTFKPIMVWPMIPRVFTEGDRVKLYASVHNRTDVDRDISVGLQVNNGKIHDRATTTVRVPAKSQVPVYWEYQPDRAGFTQLLMTAACGAGKDASLKRIPVAAMAAEQVVTASGFARGQSTLQIPAEANLDDAVLEVTMVPSLLDDTMQSLDYLVQYPHGCVEQTMSRFLPAVVVKQTLDRAGIKNPELEERLPKVVEAGIKRLLQLQKGDGGWGWHGGSQTHEMMTPYAMYGLLRAEKAGYRIPNPQAVQRGLSRLSNFIQGMKEEQASDRIYCMYVLSHRQNLHKDWWKFVEDQAAAGKLSDYALAMSLEMAINAERQELAKRLARTLRQRARRAPGRAFWTTAGFSRWGDDKFEITAAALKALVAFDPEDELIAPTLNFFATTKRGNRWNSTKDTAMIIYALCDYLATQDYQIGGPQQLQLVVNGRPVRDVKLSRGTLPVVRLPGDQLKKGANRISFRGSAPGAMYRAVFRYWQRDRKIVPLGHGLQVRREFYLLDDAGKRVREVRSGQAVPKGSYLESVVTVRNDLDEPMQYVLVENPKPATCEIVPAADRRFQVKSTGYALREDKTRGVAYHHERTGPEIVDRCVLHAELAGQYLVPPARVELMYETLTRGHSGAFHFQVK